MSELLTWRRQPDGSDRAGWLDLVLCIRTVDGGKAELSVKRLPGVPYEPATAGMELPWANIFGDAGIAREIAKQYIRAQGR